MMRPQAFEFLARRFLPQGRSERRNLHHRRRIGIRADGRDIQARKL